jgi:hypothetical protein
LKLKKCPKSSKQLKFFMKNNSLGSVKAHQEYADQRRGKRRGGLRQVKRYPISRKILS